MTDKIQSLRRIAACENKQSQPDWQGPEIPSCSEPPAFLCQTCGRLLCGGHAGGHGHPAADTAGLASRSQDEVVAARAQRQAAQDNAAGLLVQLTAAQADQATLGKIRALVATPAPPAPAAAKARAAVAALAPAAVLAV